MTAAADHDERDESASAAVRWGRLGIGLLQGALLYGLYRGADLKAWPASQPVLFAALVMVCLAAPLILLSELGRVRRATLAVWTVCAAAVLACIGSYDILSNPLEAYRTEPRLVPDFPVWLFSAAGLFIAHCLVVAGDGDRRLLARYSTYADTAWTRGVRLVLSMGFTGVFWLILWLGAALFGLIKLGFFKELIEKPWFAIPATTLVFAAAVHLTDVRTALVRAVRSVVLALLSWLSPVMGLIAVAFLLALPFTGLEPLWSTRSAGAILLSAAAALVVLLNTVYQDGRTEAPRVLRWTALAVAVTIAPLTAIAAYALMLRVGQHGWTPDRIHAAACLTVAAVYAVGYPIATVRSVKGPWLKGVEITNIVAAVTAVVLIVALFSPIADPDRIAVNDQVARVQRGTVSPADFDYRFLRFNSGRYGREALDRLAASATGPNAAAVRHEAGKARKLKAEDRYQNSTPLAADPAQRRRNIKVYPQGQTLPDSFVAQRMAGGSGYTPQCLERDTTCDAFLIDLNNDGANEIVLADGAASYLMVYRLGPGGWTSAGQLQPMGCPGVRDSLRAGGAKAVTPEWSDLEIGGRRLRLQKDSFDCDDPPAPAKPTP